MTARSDRIEAIRGEHLTEQDAEDALARLMMSIRHRMMSGEDVRLPGVGIICTGRSRRRGGRTIVDLRLDRSIGSVVGRLSERRANDTAD